MTQLEQQISSAKMMYAETLQNLEKISEDIHTQRRQERRRAKKARELAQAAGNEAIVFHPLMDVSSSLSSDEDSGNETSGDADSAELAMPPLVGVVPVKNITVRQIDCVPASSQLPIDDSTPVRPSTTEVTVQLNSQQTDTSLAQTATLADAEPADLTSGAQGTFSPSKSLSSPVSPESDIEQMQANAAVMAAISRSKLQRIASPFLRPDAGREDFSANGGSETESVSGSFVSGGLGALDDEQIESLMVDVSEYERLAADMDAAESDQCHQMVLPARLRHLQDFVKFEPVWIGDDADVAGAAHNSAAECQAAAAEVADDQVFADDADSPPCSTCLQTTNGTVDKGENLATAEDDDHWHPLMDNVRISTASESNSGHE